MRKIIPSYKDMFKKNYLYLFMIYFVFFFMNGPLEQSLVLLFQNMGFNEVFYGIFLSLNNAVGIFLPSAVAILTIKFKFKRVTIIGLLISITGGILLGIISGPWPAVICALILFSGRAFFNFSFGSIVNISIPANERAKYFVVRDLFLFGGISAGLLAGSRIISRINIGWLYISFSIGLAFALFLVLFYAGRIDNAGDTKDAEKTKRKLRLSHIKKDKVMLTFVLVQCLKQIYGTTTAFVPLLAMQLGLDAGNVLSIIGIVTFCNSILSVFLAHLSDATGRKKLFILDIIIDIIPCLLYAFTSSVLFFCIGLAVSTIKDAFAPISFAYLYDCLDDDKTVTMIGLIDSASNAVGLFIPALMGLLWSISYRSVFIIGAAACLLAAILSAINLPAKNIEMTK